MQLEESESEGREERGGKLGGWNWNFSSPFAEGVVVEGARIEAGPRVRDTVALCGRNDNMPVYHHPLHYLTSLCCLICPIVYRLHIWLRLVGTDKPLIGTLSLSL